MFIQRLNDLEKKALYDAAADFSKVMDNFEYQWWMTHHTLLNAFYFRDLAPWYDNIEFAVPRDNLPEITAKLNENGWEVKRMNPFTAKIWNPKMALHRPRFGWTWPFLDLMLYDDVPNRSIIMVEHSHCSKFTPVKRDELIDTHPYYFGPLMLPIVKRSETLLDVFYPKWRTELQSSYYCHRTERMYSETIEYEHPKELAKRFPMYNIQEEQAAG